MNFIYDEAKRAIAAGEIDFDAPDDFRCVLVMTNTTLNTESGINTIGAASTVDYCDGANHASGVGHAISGDSLTEDAGNNRAEFTATNLTISSLGAGTRQNKALIFAKWSSQDMDSSVPIAYIDTGGFPFDGNGGDVTFSWNAEGILQFT